MRDEDAISLLASGTAKPVDIVAGFLPSGKLPADAEVGDPRFLPGLLIRWPDTKEGRRACSRFSAFLSAWSDPELPLSQEPA